MGINIPVELNVVYRADFNITEPELSILLALTINPTQNSFLCHPLTEIILHPEKGGLAFG